ncbi:MAG TPA: succinate dehydrogenase cytochrome b subunit [Bdellovibrionota bacterium]|jgi:succinate dehydrogenase / fumarate reductase cytochrome b subunit|nr:succinate dehydrogenase cytochrome b subunit [Bdellovibrionota bacterium]
MSSLISLRKALDSSVGRKIIMALSGLGLVVFIVIHLAGNLLLYKADPGPFNRYAAGMMAKGMVLWVLEAGLALVFLIHIASAIRIRLGNFAARPHGYVHLHPKRGTHPTNRVGRVMFLTGILLLVFLPLHILKFRLGAGMEAGYVAYDGEKQIRDLYGLVQETFQNPLWTAFYVLVMAVLGLHLRHGIWSAFQSLGAAHPRWTRLLWWAAFAVSALLAVGFFLIPLWFYFDVPGRLL